MPLDLLDLHHASPEPHTDRAARAPVSRDVYARYEGPIPDIARDFVPVELFGIPNIFFPASGLEDIFISQVDSPSFIKMVSACG